MPPVIEFYSQLRLFIKHFIAELCFSFSFIAYLPIHSLRWHYHTQTTTMASIFYWHLNCGSCHMLMAKILVVSVWSQYRLFFNKSQRSFGLYIHCLSLAMDQPQPRGGDLASLLTGRYYGFRTWNIIFTCLGSEHLRGLGGILTRDATKWKKSCLWYDSFRTRGVHRECFAFMFCFLWMDWLFQRWFANLKAKYLIRYDLWYMTCANASSLRREWWGGFCIDVFL